MMLAFAASALLASFLAAHSLHKPQPSPKMSRATMDHLIRAQLATFKGTVCLYAKNLETGETYGIREDERVRTASTIKVPIMVTIFDEIAKGHASWTDVLPIVHSEKVSGSGVVRELSDNLRLPIRDLVHLMIVVSDNTATNLLLDRFPADLVNAEMDRLDLNQTRSLRKILGDGTDLKPEVSGVSKAGMLPDNQRFGIGVSTPAEMVSLLARMDRGELVSPEASKEMIAILKRQQYRDGIARKLGETPVANKTGSLDRLRSDVGIVYGGNRRIAIAITVDDMPVIDYSPDNPGNLLISRLTGILLEGLATWPSVHHSSR